MVRTAGRERRAASQVECTGALLVDKPSGPTSHDIVAVVRRVLKTSRVGHTGTLDPLATGLLMLLVGHATRIAQFLAADEKEYIADVRLGMSTPTYDAASLSEAVRSSGSGIRRPTDVELEAVLDRFRGAFLQVPPPYSAKKIASIPAYAKARKNQPVELKPVPVTVQTLEVLDAAPVDRSDVGGRDVGLLRLRVAASAGFYVRSLAHDLGQALGCGGHLEALRRTRVGRFLVSDALTIDRLEASARGALIPINEVIGEMPAMILTEEGTRRALHGNSLTAAHTMRGGRHDLGNAATVHAFVRLLDPSGVLVAIGECRAGGILHPLVVLR
jgi:tRNA pseudouridine55 synthase